MADIKDCLDAALKAGELTAESHREITERLDELLEDTGLSFHERKSRAAAKVDAEFQRKVLRRKRARLKQAAKQAGITVRLTAAPAGTRDKAALSVLDIDPALAHTGENVAMRHDILTKQAFAGMVDFIDRFRSKAAGLTREVRGMEDVVAALFGESAPAEAKAMAGAVMEARNRLVGRFNSAGGDLQRRKDWGWTQHHDRDAIANVSKEEWGDFVLARLDPERMLGDDGLPLSSKALVRLVDASYARIVTGGLEDMSGAFDAGFGSPITARAQHRELVFMDSKTWLEYQKRFGQPDIYSAVVGEIERLARDTALLEVMGPYPDATMRHMENLIDVDRGAVAATGEGKAARKAAGGIGKHNFLRATFDQVNGTANIPASSGWARWSQGNRNLVTSARLGTALFVSLGDFASNSLTARMNGVPVTKLLRDLFSQLNPANAAHRRMAARAGYIAETWTGHAVGAQRLMGEVTGPGWTRKIADTTLRLSGLNAWTDLGRSSFQLELIGHMTDNAGKAFADVEPALLRSMRRHGITPEQWDLFGSTPFWRDAETGAEFIRPEDVWLEFTDTALAYGEKTARFEAANAFAEMIAAEGRFAVITPTARSRAITVGGTAPGTFWGEAIRNVTLFKSFLVSHTYMHMSRAMAQRGAWSKGKYMAWLAIGMTASGAIAEQASSIFRGRDPRDMSEPRFWAASVMRGGSLGPFGDFLYGSTNRFGGSLISTLAGPVGGELEAGVKLTIGNVQELIEKGEATGVGGDLRRFAEGLTPGNSLWYTRLAFDRMIKDELEAWVDPNAPKRFRRIQRSARREYNQRFFWPPGRPLPKRLPDISRAAGR